MTGDARPASVSREAQVKDCPVSWDKSFPGRFASVQLVSIEH